MKKQIFRENSGEQTKNDKTYKTKQNSEKSNIHMWKTLNLCTKSDVQASLRVFIKYP